MKITIAESNLDTGLLKKLFFFFSPDDLARGANNDNTSSLRSKLNYQPTAYPEKCGECLVCPAEQPMGVVNFDILRHSADN